MADLKVGSCRKVGPTPENVVQVITLNCFRFSFSLSLQFWQFSTKFLDKLVCTRQFFCLFYKKRTVIISVIQVHIMIIFLTASHFRAEQIFVFSLSWVLWSEVTSQLFEWISSRFDRCFISDLNMWLTLCHPQKQINFNLAAIKMVSCLQSENLKLG